MASVFLSYDRGDATRAGQFAQVLEKAGHQVWWDTQVRGGAQFSKAIEEALATADVIVVLWSKDSVESAWVRDEASAGRDTGRLLPVTIDGTMQPIGFRQFQAIDLSRWKGRGRPKQLDMFLAEVEAKVKGEKPPTAPAKPKLRLPRFARWSWRTAAGSAAALASAAALVVWSPWDQARPTPIVAVTAATNQPASLALARDLAVKLGTIQDQSAPMQLVDQGEAGAQRPDLLLEVGPMADPNSAGANLAIKSAKDRTILWSKDFENSTRNVADLKQQMAYSGARVLGCAGEVLDPKQPRTDQETVKLYLNSCAQLAELDSIEHQPVVTELRKVIQQAPRFAGAWKKLLTAEAGVVDDARQAGTPDLPTENALRRDIAIARRLDPLMAEAALAESSLLPLEDLVKRMELADGAKQNDPNNPIVLFGRSTMLRNVGRMGDAVGDSLRAVQLDPLSPGLHANYLHSLAYTDQIDGAREELRQIEQLWPGSQTAQEMDFWFSTRFGDPKQAMPYSQAQGLKGLTLFLEARADPTKVNAYVSWLLGRKGVTAGGLGVTIQSLGQFHREQDMYRMLLSWPNTSDLATLGDVWFRPALHEFRRDRRFMLVAARTPLLHYWRATGNWPDFCNEPGLPYDCKKEAAKLPDRAA